MVVPVDSLRHACILYSVAKSCWRRPRSPRYQQDFTVLGLIVRWPELTRKYLQTGLITRACGYRPTCSSRRFGGKRGSKPTFMGYVRKVGVNLHK